MMRSMFSGISGLKGFQQSMDVIGNNIANVNTVGFKASRTTFQSMMLQTISGAKEPVQGGRGGTNSIQIGLGSQLSSVDQIMNQGSFQNTGKKTDLALQGDGFFILSDSVSSFYSRSGNFMLDESGNLVQPATGLKLQGWLSKVDPKTGKRYLDLDKPATDLFITSGLTMPAKTTTNINLGGNLNSDVGIETVTITVSNPDLPSKNYKVGLSFEKDPYPAEDLYKVFNTSYPQYTWHADIKDWNDESVNNPTLRYSTGKVTLNQFGLVESFIALGPDYDITQGGVTVPLDDSPDNYTLEFDAPPLNDEDYFVEYYTSQDYNLLAADVANGYFALPREASTRVSNGGDILFTYNVGGTDEVLVSGRDYTYDKVNNRINFTSSFNPTPSLAAGVVINLKYKVQDTFKGDSVLSSAYITEAIKRPSQFGGENGITIYNNNFTIDVLNETSSELASITPPRSSKILFMDKNDTQNYIVADYTSPKYTFASQVYDSLGKGYTIYLEFQQTATNQWAWRATEESGLLVSYVDDKQITYSPDPTNNTTIAGGVVEFDSGGRIANFGLLKQNGQVDMDTNIVRIKFDPGTLVDDGSAPPNIEGAGAVNASLDFSELVQFASDFSATVTSQDGNSMGVLQSFALNNLGGLVGTFTNGQTDTLGQIALAVFNNPAGLSSLGNTLFQQSPNSGIPMSGLPGVGGRGTMTPGVLEMSNVDLAEEFSAMVIVQRAFQANARTITTADQILQELVNLKR